MTKPDGIPQDVWSAADIVLGEGTAALRDYILDGGDAPDVGILKPFIARAIMAEREACAQVATDFSDRIGASHFVAVQVAAAIRSRGA